MHTLQESVLTANDKRLCFMLLNYTCISPIYFYDDFNGNTFYSSSSSSSSSISIEILPRDLRCDECAVGTLEATATLSRIPAVVGSAYLPLGSACPHPYGLAALTVASAEVASKLSAGVKLLDMLPPRMFRETEERRVTAEALHTVIRFLNRTASSW